MRTADVVIVGGGCMGASVAFHLSRRGITDVVLVEREPLLGAGSTGRNAGGVRHQFSHEANIRLSIESIHLFEHFQEEVGTEIDFHQDGYLFLLCSADRVAEFSQSVSVQRQLGVPVDWLAPGDAPRLAPGLDVAGVTAATFCARDGIADPNGVTMGFAGAARAAGIEIQRDTEVVDVRLERGRVAGVQTTRGDIATRIVVNAAGPWAAEVGRMAGLEAPIRPSRRHIFIAQPPGPDGWFARGPNGSRRPTAPASHIMVIDVETTFYFHREGANVLFGMSDPKEGTGFDTTVRWDFLTEVSEVGVKRLPALADSGISHAWAGLYEVTPDAMPIIGPAPSVPGFFLIAGFSGHGFQHSPAAGRILADLVAGADPGLDLSPFSLARFGSPRGPGEHHVV